MDGGEELLRWGDLMRAGDGRRAGVVVVVAGAGAGAGATSTDPTTMARRGGRARSIYRPLVQSLN